MSTFWVSGASFEAKKCVKERGSCFLFIIFCYLQLAVLTRSVLSTGSEEVLSDCAGLSSSSEEEALVRKAKMSEQNCELVHVDFEVYGTVQGVFFRKYTQKEGKKLGLRGFCQNTSAGTVTGSMEGPRPAIDQMHEALATTYRKSDVQHFKSRFQK